MKHEKSSFTLCKLCYVKHKHKSEHGIFSWIKSYVLIHVIKHDMDPNSNVNYRRKIGTLSTSKIARRVNTCSKNEVMNYSNSFHIKKFLTRKM